MVTATHTSISCKDMLLPNLPPPEEGIRLLQQEVRAFVNARSLGSGSLYIAESRITWAKDGNAGGFSLEYPHVAINAISRDTSSFPHPCLYLMLDINIEPAPTDSQSNADDDDDDDVDETQEDQISEIRFVPLNPVDLESMYKTLNECQLLHPDPEDEPSDDEYGYFGNNEDEDDDDNNPDGDGGDNENMENNCGPDHVGARTSHQVNGGEEPMETGQFDDAESEM